MLLPHFCLFYFKYVSDGRLSIISMILMTAHASKYKNSRHVLSDFTQVKSLSPTTSKNIHQIWPEDACLHDYFIFEHFGDFTVIFLPYRLLVGFAFATDSRPFLLLFQYVWALFEWGQALPIWPGASLTSADLIESTTWVKLKQAETALPWQPHYSTLRSHFTMHCDFGLWQMVKRDEIK